MMADLERWLDTAGTPPEVEEMLRAARDEKHSDQALQQSLAAIGALSAAGAVVGAATTASAASGSIPPAASGAAVAAAGAAKSVTIGAIAKWTVIGVLGSGLVGGSAIGIRQMMSPTPAPAVHAADPAVAAAPATVPAPHADSETESAEHAAPSGSSSTATSERSPTTAPLKSSAPSSLAEEVAALDRARRALSSGNAAAADRALADHAQQFPRGRLGLEAAYLRMEVAARRGDLTTARRLARQLLQRFPKAPQASRARELLGEPRP